jgi:hypothetical protein
LEQGTGYAGFDGYNDAITLNRRYFGGAFTVMVDWSGSVGLVFDWTLQMCTHIKYNTFTTRTGVFRFFSTEGKNEL